MKNGLIIDEFGHKYWYLNDQLHRVDRPAIEYLNGDKYWCQHNLYHREDGPAIEWDNGTKFWYFKGKHISCNSQQEFEQLIKLKSFW